MCFRLSGRTFCINRTTTDLNYVTLFELERSRDLELHFGGASTPVNRTSIHRWWSGKYLLETHSEKEMPRSDRVVRDKQTISFFDCITGVFDLALYFEFIYVASNEVSHHVFHVRLVRATDWMEISSPRHISLHSRQMGFHATCWASAPSKSAYSSSAMELCLRRSWRCAHQASSSAIFQWKRWRCGACLRPWSLDCACVRSSGIVSWLHFLYCFNNHGHLDSQRPVWKHKPLAQRSTSRFVHPVSPWACVYLCVHLIQMRCCSGGSSGRRTLFSLTEKLGQGTPMLLNPLCPGTFQFMNLFPWETSCSKKWDKADPSNGMTLRWWNST